MTSDHRVVDIRPGVSILSVLRHLNYKPWFAFAEFVDNSIQSFHKHRKDIEEVEGRRAVLHVNISLDDSFPSRIVISDNAAGISLADFERAFRPAAIPTERDGLSEFGMGMKSAACWFAPRWQVRTSALGESVVRTVRFDISAIVGENISALDVLEEEADPASHFTEIQLHSPFKLPTGRTLGKIAEHLSDIYRVFLQSGELVVQFGEQLLSYTAPRILHTPYYRDQTGPSRLWHKPIDFSFGNGLSVTGFAALRERGNTSRAGFALFRRGRLIQGSGDEGYRPELVFGKSNSYTYQRLFGELHLEGFEVSHTKDGFQWDDNEVPFLELLKEHLDSPELPLIQQAEGYRTRKALEDHIGLDTAAEAAVASTADALSRTLQTAIEHISGLPPPSPPPEQLGIAQLSGQASRDIEINFQGQQWRIHLEASADPSVLEWISIADGPSRAIPHAVRTLGLRVSLAHPFMIRYMGAHAEDLEGLFRIAAALGLAEVLAREGGVRLASAVVSNVNTLLRESLAN